jgi:hypothetical protein
LVLSEGRIIPAVLSVAGLNFNRIESVLAYSLRSCCIKLSDIPSFLCDNLPSVTTRLGIFSIVYFKALPSEALNLLFKAFCVAVDIGLLASEVLSTLPNPT